MAWSTGVSRVSSQQTEKVEQFSPTILRQCLLVHVARARCTRSENIASPLGTTCNPASSFRHAHGHGQTYATTHAQQVIVAFQLFWVRRKDVLRSVACKLTQSVSPSAHSSGMTKTLRLINTARAALTGSPFLVAEKRFLATERILLQRQCEMGASNFSTQNHVRSATLYQQQPVQSPQACTAGSSSPLLRR